jgi:hypothetical protein
MKVGLLDCAAGRGQRAIGWARRAVLLIVLVLCLWIAPVAAYHPFLHLTQQDGEWLRIPERFDLREAPAGAVPVVVSRPAGIAWHADDNWEALVSQIKLAATVWSEVSTSSLRLGYAGEVAVQADSSAPHIQIVFDDLPPGVIAMAGPVSMDTQRIDEHGRFVPITKSLVIHNADLTQRPTHGEAFFRTLVHELGHAVGLQHTFTGSAMATGITRSTTKAAPLAADDAAGVSWLYPSKFFARETGTIRGRITVDREPLHFASVVALSASGTAVSAITLPDGSYEIKGVPAGYYYLYAQMIPPSSDPSMGPGQIILPVDERGRSFQPGPSFGTRFYPNGKTWSDAFLLDVQPGTALREMNIDVPSRAPSRFHGITTYSFLGQTVNQPAVLNSNDPDRFLVAYGPNLTDAPEGLEGLEVEALGAFVWERNVFPYPFAEEFLQVGMQLSPFSFSGPKAMLFRRQDDIHVQPAAFHLVSQAPPRLHEMLPEEVATGSQLRVRGEELGVVSQYVADGLRLPLRAQASERSDGLDAIEDTNAEVSLRQPYTGDGRMVPVVALARDRQSSLFASPETPRAPTMQAPHGGVRLIPDSLPAGAHAAIVVESDQPLFSGESLWVDFGSPSLVVTGAWKESDYRLTLNVAVSTGASAGNYVLRLHNDLALREPGAALFVRGAEPGRLAARGSLRDVETESNWVRAGATTELLLAGLDDGSEVDVEIAGRWVAARRVHPEVWHFEIPGEIPPSVVTWRVRAGGNESLPLATEIYGEPARIVTASVSARADRISEGQAVSARFRAEVKLPEGVPPNGNGALRVRVNGRMVSGVQIAHSDETGGLLSVSFSARVPWDEAVRSEIYLQAEWSSRPSPIFPLRLDLGQTVSTAAVISPE